MPVHILLLVIYVHCTTMSVDNLVQENVIFTINFVDSYWVKTALLPDFWFLKRQKVQKSPVTMIEKQPMPFMCYFRYYIMNEQQLLWVVKYKKMWNWMVGVFIWKSLYTLFWSRHKALISWLTVTKNSHCLEIYYFLIIMIFNTTMNFDRLVWDNGQFKLIMMSFGNKTHVCFIFEKKIL